MINSESMPEKSSTVLWALTPFGIVLHNFHKQVYLELRGSEEKVWALLDGTHSVTTIVQHLQREGIKNAEDIVERTINQLRAGEFLRFTEFQ